jgi:glutamyl-tRNA synthetase
MTIITRFAPSPTGFLHIGAARTALFNYLFAKKHGGKFLLRVEDTDQKRSTEEAVQAIFKGLEWLDIKWDDEIVFQNKNIIRHQEIAKELLNKGHAYECYLSPEELDDLRQESRKSGKVIQSKWRDNKDNLTPPENINPVIRLKTPTIGELIFEDLVQGTIKIKNENIDDFVLLRADGTPTYMLAVVVDDYDMKISHIIRGDDHLNNTPKQILIYNALNWQVPHFAHIPLIHGDDGAKLSKRHGALGVDAYAKMGYLKDAINNSLLRMGWSDGDKEIFSRDEAINSFNIESIGKSPARLDFNKMDFLNAHYIAEISDQFILDYIQNHLDISPKDVENLSKAILHIKPRVKLLPEILDLAKLFITNQNLNIDSALIAKIKDSSEIYNNAVTILKNNDIWEREFLTNLCKEIAKEHGIKLGVLAGLLRIALTGKENAPSIFDIMSIIGKEESLQRLQNI